MVYNDTKDRYYKALGHYDKTGEVSEFVEYMKDSLERTWERSPVQQKRLDSMLKLDEL